jgi:hypothetical protein
MKATFYTPFRNTFSTLFYSFLFALLVIRMKAYAHESIKAEGKFITSTGAKI